MPSMYLEQLLTTAGLRESTLKTAIKALELPEGSNGLDVGCGAGLQCHLLADEIGPGGHVTGLDISAEFLATGKSIAEKAGLEARISFKKGAAEAIPFDDNSFDWAWSVDCVGYGPWEPLPLLEELKRVIRPGGTLAILAWSSERLLPGYPLLEARLGATGPGLLPFSSEMPPSRHFHRALGLLRKLGLDTPKASVFVGSAQAPLSDELHTALAELFAMRWEGVEDELSENDLAEYNRLCQAESPDFILGHPDYFAFFTYSMFHGTVS